MTQKQGKFVVIDTTLTKTDATLVDELSGRQGDNGRIVYFALKDGNLPHNIDGQDVKLSVKDASGKIKVLTGIYDRINVTAGLFSMLIPAEFYQAAGDVEEAYLAVIDNAGTTISSIPITFTVFANGVIISANASKDYIDTVQNFLDEFNKRITTTSNNLETVRTAVNSLNDAITNYTDLVNTKAVAIKTSTNEFTENNTFDKDITVKGAIHGKADTAGKADGALTADSANTAVTADNAKALAKTARLDNIESVHSVDIKLLGGTLSLYRAGSIISVTSKIENNTVVFKQYAQIAPANTVPVGYRPIAFTGILNLHQADWLANRNSGQIVLELDGSITTKNAFNNNTTQASNLEIFGSYVTNDDMPRN